MFLCLKKMACQIRSHPHLDDAVHVGDETVDADFQQHDESPAHILPHFTVLIAGQCKQTLDTKMTIRERERENRWQREDGRT